jgi:hypothetical protein
MHPKHRKHDSMPGTKLGIPRSNNTKLGPDLLADMLIFQGGKISRYKTKKKSQPKRIKIIEPKKPVN